METTKKQFEVSLLVERDKGYCYTGQVLHDIISAVNEQGALDTIYRQNLLSADDVYIQWVKEL